MSSEKPTITIIGTGALGSTLEKFFREEGYPIRSTWNSKGGIIQRESNSEYCNASYSLPQDITELGDLVFITTPDDLISDITVALAELSVSWDDKMIIHCSGNLNSGELHLLSEKGAKIISMHPVQTFKRGDERERFRDIYVSLEGDTGSTAILKPIINAMGAKPIVLDKDQKRVLHIAAVMASNYLVALMFAAEIILKKSGIDNGLNILQSLAQQTLTNIFEKGSKESLTGPIARGDVQSVEMHLNELKGKEQEILYKVLGQEALKIAKRSGSLSESQVEKLENLLQESLDE